MASLTKRTWVWVNSRSWWWTGRPDVLRSMELQRVGHDWATELNWTANETRSSPLSPVGCTNKKAVMSSICSKIPTNRRKKAYPGKRHPEKVRDSMSLKNLNNKEMNLEGLRVVFFFFFLVGFDTFTHTVARIRQQCESKNILVSWLERRNSGDILYVWWSWAEWWNTE